MSGLSSFTALLLLPWLGALGVVAFRRYPNLREACSLVTGIGLCLLLYPLYQSLQQGHSLRFAFSSPLSGIDIAFRLEPLGFLFAGLASLLWVVTTLYSIGYMRTHQEANQTRFFSFFAVAIGAVLALATSDNLLTLFLFYEVLTLSTYPLVAHGGDAKAKTGARQYLCWLLGSSIALLLPAILLVWQQAGTLSFAPGGILPAGTSHVWLSMVSLLFLFGVGKAAVMPMHRWLPAAMVAPTPVSALLHAVAVVKAGVFSLLKIYWFILGPEKLAELSIWPWLLWLPALTILLASLIALSKDNIKERLAYSTIGQLSYIVLGALLANVAGFVGATLHIMVHGFAKISLFFVAGALLVSHHKTRVSELDGMGKTMPYTFAIFTLGSLSIIGLPPAAGLWSKWYLSIGSIQAGQWLLVGILMLSSLLNIAYLLVIPARAYLKAPSTPAIVGEAPFTCRLAMLLPVIISLWLFFNPDFITHFAQWGMTYGNS